MKIDPKLLKKHKFYGTAVVGAKGQIVIPADARKDLNIKTGDRLIVMGKLNKALGLMKTEHLSEMVKMIMDMIGNNETARVELKKYISKIYSKLKK